MGFLRVLLQAGSLPALVAAFLVVVAPPGAPSGSVATLPGEGPTPGAPESLIDGTCLSCPDFDFGCFDITPTWQTHAATTTGFGDCAWYCFQVDAGKTYQFATCAPGSAAFDTVLQLHDAPGCGFLGSADDECGDQSLLEWTAGSSGTVRLQVRGSFGADGDYTLAWREVLPCGDGTCAAPNATLNEPLTTCQLLPDRTCAGDTVRTYDVTLTQGQTYTFTLCDATCAGAGASFDSRVELWRGGALVASSSAACGDDGEVVFATDPFSGGGAYCVRVIRESSPGLDEDFTLGYRVACQAPSDITVSPDSAVTTSDDCSRLQTFNATTAGTGPFTYAWTVTPNGGGMADPPSGSVEADGNSAQFQTTLTGADTYQVEVTVSNECGDDVGSLVFELLDGAGPNITCQAEGLLRGCLEPTGVRAAAEPVGGGADDPESLAFDREEVLRIALEAADPEAARLAIAEKLGVAASRIAVFDEEEAPVLESPLDALALDCAPPCTSGTESVLHPFYDVAVNCSNGDFTARTGAAHSVTTDSGSPQNVIFGGAGLSPGTSDITFHVHAPVVENYLSPGGGAACVFDPPDTVAEPASVGIEQEWTRSPTPGIDLILRQEVVAFGDTEANSGVRLTLGATNEPGSAGPVTMGVRWQIDYQNASDDGPLFAAVQCDPFTIGDTLSTEHEFTAAELEDQDFYRIQNNTGSPIFGNFTSTAPISGFPATEKPDRFLYGRWPSMSGSGWNYTATEGANADGDSATLNYYGYLPADGILLNPGESFRRSVVIFTRGEEQSCGDFVPGSGRNADVQICPGECARIGATATDNCDPDPTVTLVAVDPPTAPPCVGNPCEVSFPDEGTYTYTWEATDAAGNATRCTSTVRVVLDDSCNEPPTCDAGGPYESECRDALVDGATVEDPDADPISYAWSTTDPRVAILDASGTIPGGVGPQPVPPATVVLADDVLPCGVTVVLTLTVDDGRGGVATCETTVTFDDRTPPEVTESAAIVACLWPPNHWYVCFDRADLAPEVTDNCDEPTWEIVGCTSDQPDDARDDADPEWNGDGHTTDDCVLLADGDGFCVRAERAGTGPAAQDGRHYGLLVVATDSCGNVSDPTLVGRIHVPHDQSPAAKDCIKSSHDGIRPSEPQPND